jgi:hypothetical protein
LLPKKVAGDAIVSRPRIILELKQFIFHEFIAERGERAQDDIKFIR